MEQLTREQLYNVATLMPVGLLFLNNAGDCMYANTSFAQMIGVDSSKALGKGWLLHIEADDREKIESLWKGEAIEARFTYSSATSRIRLKPATTEKELYCFIAEDITEQWQSCAGTMALQALLDAMDTAVFSFDHHFKYTAFNKAFQEIAVEFGGRPVQTGDCFAGINAENPGELFQEIANGRTLNMSHIFGKAVPHLDSYNIVCSPLSDAGGDITGIKGIFRHTSEELTEKGEVSRQKELMQAILDSTDAILYSVDTEGKITAFNKAASQAIQLRKGVDVKIGDYWPDIVGGDSGLDKEKMTMLLHQVIAGESYSTIEDMLIGNGENATYSVQASPIIDARKHITGAVLCAQNITILTRLQKEAAEKALQRTRELESWNQFYDMLLSVLAHDLRQPFSTIIMAADVAKYTEKIFSADEIKTIMTDLRSTSSKSIELLQGLLYWVKSKKEDFSYRPVPLILCDLVNEANSLFVHDQKKRGISLHNDVPKGQILYAHNEMMLFVCRNLINNATKYTPSNSAIYVKSTIVEDEMTISVQDNGKGMSASQLAQLFTIRKNAGEANEGIKGAGVALTIAHDMITQMNGRIRAESEPGMGTTFYITFPAGRIPA